MYDIKLAKPKIKITNSPLDCDHVLSISNELPFTGKLKLLHHG